MTTPLGAANAPVTQTCWVEVPLPGEQVEPMGRVDGVEVPVHCALAKTFRVAAVLLVQDTVAHRPLPTELQPMLLKILAEELPEQSVVV